MSFTSTVFLILFFPICIIMQCMVKDNYRNILLCVMSAVFYAWCGIRFLLLILLSSTIAYIFGICIWRAKDFVHKNIYLLCGLVCSLGTLLYYKYWFDIANAIMRQMGIAIGDSTVIAMKAPALPLGISFYTFSIISFLLDIYWEKCSGKVTITDFYLYILFFPKVIQGPIVQYTDFECQFYNRKIDLELISNGLELFIKGMVKKVMIADQVQPLVSYSFENISAVGTIPAWLGLYAYLLQLYYDFSGYSDMALGIGMMMGFRLPKNFDHPYLSKSVAEYWRRWHITLGEWFRNYVYMPCSRKLLGQSWIRKLSRPMIVCDILSLLVVWILTGIWHGSGMKYVIWGLWFFLFIALERMWDVYRKQRRKKKNLAANVDSTVWRIIRRTLTIAAIVFGQVIFRADTLHTAMQYWKKLIIWNKADGILFFHQFDNYMVFALSLGTIFIFPLYDKCKKFLEKRLSTRLLYEVGLLAAFFVAFCYSVSAGYSAFLYEVF